MTFPKQPSPSQSPLPINIFASEKEIRERLALADLDDASIDAVAAGGSDLVAAARALTEAGNGEAAVTVLAQGLKRRAAVWWACAVVRREPAPEVPPADSPRLVAARAREQRALEAAEAWVLNPGEAAALAAFLGGESLAPPGAMPVPPADHLAGIAVSGAIRIAAVRHRPEKSGATLRDFLEIGQRIAAGTESWE